MSKHFLYIVLNNGLGFKALLSNVNELKIYMILLKRHEYSARLLRVMMCVASLLRLLCIPLLILSHARTRVHTHFIGSLSSLSDSDGSL